MKLAKILHSESNIPESIMHVVGGKAATFRDGTACVITDGVLTACSGDATAKYIVLGDQTTEKNTDEVLVYRVLEAMVFEAELSAYTASTVKAGAKVTFYTDGNKLTATAATNNGALIVDTCGASAAGDTVFCVLA